MERQGVSNDELIKEESNARERKGGLCYERIGRKGRRG
jgi:hypothetical protein